MFSTSLITVPCLRYPAIAAEVFMFNIDVIEGNPDERLQDDRIGLTVLQVFNLFFQRSQNVAEYICDSIGQPAALQKTKIR